MCLYPKLIKNKKYLANKKNGGNIPPVLDERTTYIPVGCQNCIECRKQKAKQWQVRLMEDIKEHKNGKFITLTFSDQSIKNIIEGKNTKGEIIKGRKPLTLFGYELDNEIATVAMRDFLERWRKEYKKSLRHWMVTELGHNGTENIHLHGIIWTDEKPNIIEEIWQYGFIWKGQPLFKNGELKGYKNYVSEQTINYIIKYVTKPDEIHTHYKSKILTSPGIGHNYIKETDIKDKKYIGKNRYNNNNTIETYQTRTGHKMNMPTYWRNKIYTEEEREKLWLQKLDKEERWILGQKISIKHGYETYDKAIKYARIKNKKLGYRDEMKSEDEQLKKLYENDRRKILQQTRIQKAFNKTPPAG